MIMHRGCPALLYHCSTSSLGGAGWQALTMAMASRLLLAVRAAALLHPAPAPPPPSRIVVIILDE